MTELFADGPETAAAWQRLLAIAAAPDAAQVSRGRSGALDAFAELYLPVAAPARTPFVIAQLGQSVDGFIATESGASHYVTGPESLVHLHRLRALCDAVVVGWRTVAADDPQLTVRRATGDNPLRVVIDLEGRLGVERRAFAADAPGALRLTGHGIAPLPGIESVEIAATDGRFDPADVIATLSARGARRILIEGGGATVSSFLAAGALDRLHLAIAPVLIGGGRRGLAVPPVRSLNDAMRAPSRQIAMGNDVLFDFDLAAAKAR